MSLTSMLGSGEQHEKRFQKLVKAILPAKETFTTASGEKAFSKYEIKVPYALSGSGEASVVGTTFEFIAKLMIARIVDVDGESVVLCRKAHKGMEKVEKILSQMEAERLRKDFISGLTDCFDYVWGDESKRVPNIFDNLSSKDKEEWVAWNAFITRAGKRGYVPLCEESELISSVFLLAKLENIYHSGREPSQENIVSFLRSEPSSQAVYEIKQMCRLFRAEFIERGRVRPDSIVVFSPSFGTGSFACGGADADIYIDGVLYEFKAGKKTGYSWAEVAQVIMYYHLNKITQATADVRVPAELKNYPLQGVAIYRARFGEIEYCCVKEIEEAANCKEYEELIEFLLERARHLSKVQFYRSQALE